MKWHLTNKINSNNYYKLHKSKLSVKFINNDTKPLNCPKFAKRIVNKEAKLGLYGQHYCKTNRNISFDVFCRRLFNKWGVIMQKYYRLSSI